MEAPIEAFETEVVVDKRTSEKVLVVNADVRIEEMVEFELDVKDLDVSKVKFRLLYNGKPWPHES